MSPGTYAPIHAASLSDRDGFWAARATDIAWTRRWDKVCDDSRPPFYRWFAGGELNTCFNAVDRHVEAGHGDLFGGHRLDVFFLDHGVASVEDRRRALAIEGGVGVGFGRVRAAR